MFSINDLKMAIRIFAFLAFVTGCFFACQHRPENEKQQKKGDEEKKYVSGELPVQAGMELFNQYCASCHNFVENGIGPNLVGVTAELEKEWLISFIHNPQSVIESGDERAVQLFERYKLYMPSFPTIQGEDMENLLGFIHKFSEGEKRNKSNRPGALIDPIVDKINQSDVTLVIEEWLTVPSSAETSPVARINKMETINSRKAERFFVSDLRGKLYEIVNDSARVYLDIQVERPKFIENPGFGTGLGSFAFHPEFQKNGLLYTTHTEAPKTAPADFAIADSIRTTLQWVLLEWKTATPGADKFRGPHRELLRADMVSGIHGFQELTFNPLATPGSPDYGLLYLGVGDGGAALQGYPFLCNNKGKIWGKVLRIDPAGSNSINGKYGIPADNPFVKDPSALGEVWAGGFRNPHRIAWDKTGSAKMFISNIGQHSVEEVHIGKAGADYGWPNREGRFLFDVNANTEVVYPLPADDAGYSYPEIQYDHDEGNAVCGGYVYSGSKAPSLRGKYIFGDIPRGTLFYTEVKEIAEGLVAPVYKLKLKFQGQLTDLETVTQNKRVDLRFGQDSQGELYLLTKSNGKVYRVIGGL